VLIVKCVIGFGRLVRILENPMGILERNHYFNVQQHNKVYVLGDDFFGMPMNYWIWCFEFVFLISHLE
jgi:hypothetical protein